MSEWTIVEVLVVLIGLFFTVGNPVIKLNKSITTLEDAIKSLEEKFSKNENKTEEQEKRLEDHEIRIVKLEDVEALRKE